MEKHKSPTEPTELEGGMDLDTDVGCGAQMCFAVSSSGRAGGAGAGLTPPDGSQLA